MGAALSNPPTPGSGVRGDGRNREEGSLGSSRGGAMAWGCHAGEGPSPAPMKCRESCMWPMFPARGAGRGIQDRFEGLREPPSGTFGVRNWIPRRPQHGFRSFPRHVSTTSFPWGRRQWAHPSRMQSASELFSQVYFEKPQSSPLPTDWLTASRRLLHKALRINRVSCVSCPLAGGVYTCL